MNKASSEGNGDELRPEYDFASLGGAVRGKYYERFRAGVNLRLLEPEIAKAFPTDIAVNRALRSVLRAAKPSKKRAVVLNERAQTTKTARSRRRSPRG